MNKEELIKILGLDENATDEQIMTAIKAGAQAVEELATERTKAEATEAEKAQALNGRYEQTEGYKTLRRFWWGCLIGAIVLTAVSFYLTNQEGMQSVSMVAMVIAYALIIVAFYIDLGKIRKERKIYNASIANSNTKEARREQKRMRAEQREMEKEAAEKFEAAKAEEEAKKSQGFFSRFRKKDQSSEQAQDQDQGKDDSKEQ